jgi:hypothetical protein
MDAVFGMYNLNISRGHQENLERYANDQMLELKQIYEGFEEDDDKFSKTRALHHNLW